MIKLQTKKKYAKNEENRRLEYCEEYGATIYFSIFFVSIFLVITFK
jgi:hypothetical protein